MTIYNINPKPKCTEWSVIRVLYVSLNMNTTRIGYDIEEVLNLLRHLLKTKVVHSITSLLSSLREPDYNQLELEYFMTSRIQKSYARKRYWPLL